MKRYLLAHDFDLLIVVSPQVKDPIDQYRRHFLNVLSRRKQS